MPKTCIIKNNGYWYEAWNVPLGGGKRTIKKRPIKDLLGKTMRIKDYSERQVLTMLAKSDAAGGQNSPGNVTTAGFLPVFRQILKDKGKKDNTIREYCRDVENSVSSLPSNIKDIEFSHINNYIDGLTFAPTTKAGIAKSLNRFFSMAVGKGIITKNPVNGYEFPTFKPNVNPFSESDILKLIEASKELQRQFNEPYYDFMMFALQTGLRLDEYVNLRWKYLNDTGTYNICEDDTWRPKHDHCRTIQIPQLSLNLIKALPVNGEYIFHKNGKRHHHFTRDFVNNIFKGAGVEGNLHQVRKTFASYRLGCGQAPQNLQHDLGHKHLKELEAYIGRIRNPSYKMKEIWGDY